MDVEVLRREAGKHIRKITASADATSALWPSPLSLSQEAEASSLQVLVTSLDLSQACGDVWQVFEKVLVLDLCLAQGRKFDQNPSTRNAAAFIREWVAKAILPTQAFAEQSPYATEESPVLSKDEIARLHEMGVRGLGLLTRLQKSFPLLREESAVDLFTCLASYSDASDPWTSLETRKNCQVVLDDYVDSNGRPNLITDLLKERVKPLFARSKNPAITPQGRRAIDPHPSNDTSHSDLNSELKPWKYRDVYIVTVFQWVLGQLNEASVEANWPLLIPPLLALIDDSSISLKAKGCNFIHTFLQTCPSPLLERTGLGEVFENALMPCLLYLPSLTEEAESLQVLNAAYPTLMSLANVRFASEKHHPGKMKAFDKVLRHGIVKGYANAGEHVKIAELLVNRMTELINEMGVESAKHLKHILPLLSASLASPFATAYPPLLLASATATQAITVTDWPRVAYHRSELLKGLAICWCRIDAEQQKSKDLKNVQEMIEQATRLLTSVLERDVDVDVAAEYQILIDSEPRLQSLLVL